MHTYRLHWFDGKMETVIGEDIIYALVNAGYGNNAKTNLDWYEEL